MMMAMMAIRSVVRGGVRQVMRNLISQYQLIIMYIHYLHHHSCHEYNILLAILWANQMDLVYKDAPPYQLCCACLHDTQIAVHHSNSQYLLAVASIVFTLVVEVLGCDATKQIVI